MVKSVIWLKRRYGVVGSITINNNFQKKDEFRKCQRKGKKFNFKNLKKSKRGKKFFFHIFDH